MPLSPALAKQRRELTKLWLRLRLPIVAGVVAIVVLGSAVYGWRVYTRSAEEAQRRETQESAEQIAGAVRSTLDEVIRAVDAAVDQGALGAVVASGDGAAVAEREAALAEKLPSVLGVRLLAADVGETDYASVPPITYAALEMMRRTRSSGEAQPPEVLLLDEKEQHLALVRSLSAPDGSTAGYALIGVDLSLLRDAIARAPLSEGYAELIQLGGKGKNVVASRGDSRFKHGQPDLTLAVPPASLRVQFWSASAAARATAQAGAGPPTLALVAGALVLALLGAAFVVRRRRAAAAIEDTAPKMAAPSAGATATEAPRPVEATAAPEPNDLPPASVEVEAVEISPTIFRAYDVRGVVEDALTPQVVRMLGLAIGSEAYDRGQQTLVVGCDGRRSSPTLVSELIDGLREAGRDVIDIGRVPTPVVYFATHYLETGSGVMVTGSHNPPEYNGLKIMLAGDTLFGDEIQALRARIESGQFTNGAGNLQSMDIAADYIRRVTEDVPVALGNAFKVVVDCGNGVAGDFAPKLLRALGHDIVELFCEVDGDFPNHHPDPSQPKNLEQLIAAVADNDADLGFAFDGDGDRLGVVDSSGAIIWPDTQMMLYAYDVLSRNAGAEIVFDVKCSSRLAKVISKRGGKPVMFKTGHSFIKNKLKETGAPLAGEMSGHIFFKERWYGFDDALYASARMLEILMGFKEKPADVFAKLPKGVSTPELRLDMREGEQAEFMSQLADVDFGDARVTTIDGVRVDWPDGWGLVRASNTTPSLVLRFEGDDEAALKRVQEVFRRVLLAQQSDLSLPF